MRKRERERGENRKSELVDALVLAVKVEGEINCNKGNNSKIRMQKPVENLMCVCHRVVVILILKEVRPTSLPAVIAAPPESLSGIQHPSGAKVIERTEIILIK